MIGTLAGGIGAVVAACARSCTGESTVVRLGSGPDRGRFVAAFATGCRGQMVVRFATSNGSVVTAGATRAHRHIGVELGWCPGRVALVARCAVCSR